MGFYLVSLELYYRSRNEKYKYARDRTNRKRKGRRNIRMKKDLKCFEVVFPPQNKNNLVFFYTLKFEVIRRGGLVFQGSTVERGEKGLCASIPCRDQSLFAGLLGHWASLLFKRCFLTKAWSSLFVLCAQVTHATLFLSVTGFTTTVLTKEIWLESLVL